MTTDRKIFQMALEALERYSGVDQRACDAEDALRERLSHCDRCGKPLGDADHIHTCTPQHTKKYVTKEPVAWRTFDGEGGYDYRTYDENENYAEEWAKRNPRHVGWVDALYTESQRLDWRGLDRKEMLAIIDQQQAYKKTGLPMFYRDQCLDMLRAIEAKLKEKNT